MDTETQTPHRGGNRQELFKLREIAHDEELAFLEAHQKRVAFYSSLISAILVATLAGALKAENALHYFLLILGPVLVFSIAAIAKDATRRFYRRYVEAVTMEAKLDQALDLTDPDWLPKRTSGYWIDESLIPQRFLNSRKEAENSQAFIDKRLDTGYQGATRSLFVMFEVIAVVLAVCLICVAVVTPCGIGGTDGTKTPANEAINASENADRVN
jgi:hypothetical protein